jgi:uncharacterized protein (DUF305 family)
MKRPILILLVLVAVAAAAAMLYLRQPDRGRDSASSSRPSGPSAEMLGAMDRMHGATPTTAMTGDIDRDFVSLMIPHHESAVEMARVYLKHGKDPGLRRLAENVVASQEAEIRQMSGRRSGPASASAPPAAGPHPAH